MEDRIAVLKQKLAHGLKELAEIKVELDRADGTIKGVPHYSLIENSAHEFGREVGRTVQERHARELVAQTMHQVTCPGCQSKVQPKSQKRTLTSLDGPVEILETVAHCPSCRRDFFPST